MDGSLLSLANEHADALIGLLGVAFGTSLTGGVAWFTTIAATRQLQIQLEHQELLQKRMLERERLEELFVLVGHWLDGLSGRFMALTLVMQGHQDYNHYLDSIITSESRGDLQRMEMILGIYGQEVSSSYQQAVAAREQVNDLIAEHRQAYERGENGMQFVEPFTKLHLKLIEKCETLRADIAQLARTK